MRHKINCTNDKLKKHYTMSEQPKNIYKIRYQNLIVIIIMTSQHEQIHMKTDKRYPHSPFP